MSVIKRVASMVLLAGAAALTQAAFAQQTIKIGAINPYSGPLALYGIERSEERRVGKECKHWCRSRWSRA